MVSNKPVIKQLDHVIARVDDAEALHRLFSETFQLPVSWAVKSYKAFKSGGISLGNTNLEILTVGAKSDADGDASARFCAFAFECESLSETVEELGRRKLKCSSVVPYIESPAEGLPKTHLWSNAFLDGLAGSDLWTRYVIFSTKMPGYQFWANLLRGSRVEQQGISRLFSGALVFLVEYEYQNFKNMPLWSDFKNHDEKRAADAEALRAQAGGALGLLSVQEITVSVKDYERANENWKKLFAPVQPLAQGLWEVADGPAVRVVRGERDLIQGLVFKVADLERAKTFLREKGMLDSTSSEQIRIDPAAIYGLDIRLV
ncbi:MAG TPA: hypothetical protein VGC66_01835 [Pyrinomonadaceae bacterium]